MSIVCKPGGVACSEPPRTFTARSRGTAEITAARSTCGTTQRCVTPMLVPVAGFEVTVIVD
ncbi:hypothetical protein [Catenulispora acidiphila]|uniref:hypothetical protein n=1 Tax=Catenulispora acidiphila TaxID=304895 RepID=UPI0001A2E5AF|nr:hypothetical protein [Catenulispora acidiphila]